MVTSAGSDSGAAPATKYFSSSDPVWLLLACALVAVNLFVSLNDFRQARHTETTRMHAQYVADLIVRLSQQRTAGKPGPEACQPTSMWSTCQQGLLGMDAHAATLRNLLKPGGPVFSNGCDRQRPSTLGTIVIEVGTPKPNDPESLTYAPIQDEQVMKQRLPMRVAVCGRLYSKMLIADVVL